MVTRKSAAAKAPAKKTTKAASTKRAAAKPAAKDTRTAKTGAVDAGRAEKADKTDKADKTRKPKLVRDSFTIPKAEYEVLADLKQRAAKLGRPAKKSEVIRAGVQALAGMGDAAFLAALGAVPAVKTGRPAKV